MAVLSIEYIPEEEVNTSGKEHKYLEDNLKRNWHLISVTRGVDPINLQTPTNIYYWLLKPEPKPRMYMRVTHLVLLPGEELSFLSRQYIEGLELISVTRGDIPHYTTYYFKSPVQHLWVGK